MGDKRISIWKHCCPRFFDIVFDTAPRWNGGRYGTSLPRFKNRRKLYRVRFPNPVTSASNVRTRTKLVGVDEINDECVQVVGEVTIEIEGKEKPACVAEMVSRYYF